LITEEANAFDAIASGKNIGVKVNIESLDKHTNGWQNGNLIIIAARPSMGKSVLALNNAKEAAKNNVPTAMFSLEMSSVELMQRLASDEANIDFSLVQKAKTTDEQRGRVNTALGRIENLPLYIDDTAQTTVLGIWNKAARIKSEYGLGLIVIDYIQLISAPEVGNYADANARVSHITRNLKLMAKELNVPVIALSQLSRDVEKRGGLKKPILSDLRDSGSIEQDADVVLFPWRPSYYNITHDGNGFDYREDYAELIFAKHRNGVLGSVRVSFDGSKQRFTSYQDGISQPNFPVKDFSEQIKPNNNFDDEADKPF
jgi:replicative DNA helicase